MIHMMVPWHGPLCPGVGCYGTIMGCRSTASFGKRLATYTYGLEYGFAAPNSEWSA